MSAQAAVDREPTEALFPSFSAFLSSERNSTRFPHGLRKFLHAVQSEQTVPPSTPRIFLDHGGAKALIAYFVVKPGTAHASGNEALRQRFADLDDLSTTDRAQLAQRVGEVDVHPTIGDLVRQVENQMVGEQLETGPRPAKRPRTNEYPMASSDSSSLVIDQVPGSRATDLSTVHADNPSFDEEGELVSGAYIQAVVDMFPEYLSDAIRRDGAGDSRRAAVTVSFPRKPFGAVTCIMTLAVRSNKVERLADLLFGAHLETEGQSREVVLESGCRILVLPKVVIQGCRISAISKVFGPAIAEAIATAPYRRQEVLDGISTTRCVTMTVYSDERGADISLSLGLKEGSQIYERLCTMIR